MNPRRDFLKRLGIGAASVATLGAVTLRSDAKPLPDDFEHNGIRVRWSGWRMATNQDVRIGYWIATLGNRGIAYSTTGGVVDMKSYELNTFNMQILDGWPGAVSAWTDADFEHAKSRARIAMIAALNAA